MAKKKLTPKQMQIARVAPPRNKITGADFKNSKKARKVGKHDEIPTKALVCYSKQAV